MLVPVMKKVRFDNGAVEVDAALIAAGLGIAPEQVQADMRAGRITSACERGVDEDAGTFRLSFFAGNRRLRLTVDAGGELIRRSTVTTGDPPR
ncbi:MAG: hypothetical protein J0I73_16465 [Sphingomonas sp.]|uniref:DUF6522 family protein n=2 Tax=unclassified Sphingomonas TaxID=196159 RepID=UPI001AC3C662|nr:DUF6522 family protein [Sphingomonas sp.]MBN8849667.1 hypothetical protein [Sphingomonas sp.]